MYYYKFIVYWCCKLLHNNFLNNTVKIIPHKSTNKYPHLQNWNLCPGIDLCHFDKIIWDITFQRRKCLLCSISEEDHSYSHSRSLRILCRMKWFDCYEFFPECQSIFWVDVYEKYGDISWVKVGSRASLGWIVIKNIMEDLKKDWLFSKKCCKKFSVCCEFFPACCEFFPLCCEIFPVCCEYFPDCCEFFPVCCEIFQEIPFAVRWQATT